MDVSSQKSLELFAALGNRLKTAREAKGLTIPEVSANTRINQAFLNAIEGGNPDPLPSVTFVRGFIRNFALALGLDVDDMMAEFRRFTDLQDKVEMPLEPPSEVMDPAPVTIPMPRLLTIGVVLVLVIWVGYLIIGSGSEADDSQDQAEQSESAAREDEEEAESDPPTGSAAAVYETTQPAASGPPLPTEPPKSLRLRVRGLERTWIRLSVDRREPTDIHLQPAETGEWEANEEFRLTVGKSHGVSVYLNDEEILLPAEPNLLIPDIVLNKVTLFKLEN